MMATERQCRVTEAGQHGRVHKSQVLVHVQFIHYVFCQQIMHSININTVVYHYKTQKDHARQRLTMCTLYAQL